MLPAPPLFLSTTMASLSQDVVDEKYGKQKEKTWLA